MILLEKISKQEFEEAINNPRVKGGVEFEFIVPSFVKDYEKRIKETEELQELEGELIQYDQDIEDWHENGDEGDPPKLPKILKDADPDLQDGDDVEVEDYKEMFLGVKQSKAELFKILTNDYLHINKALPANSYIITSNEKGKSKDKWVIKPDGSLGVSGIEVVTPAMPLSELLVAIPKFFKHIDKYGKTNDYCGFHISMSLDGISDLTKTLDVIKLALFTDEDYIYKAFEMRKYNKYAKSIHSEIKSGDIVGGSIEQVIDIGKVQKDYQKDHMMAINIEHLDPKGKNKYIEYRYIGGANYHRKWPEIRKIMAMYSYALSMACDPEYKKKEYILKLNRVINKVELFTLLYNYVILTSDEQQRSQKEIADKIRLNINNKNEILKRATVLSKFVNLSPQDIRDMLSNQQNESEETAKHIMILYKEIR